MKKLIINCILITLAILTIACKSVPQEAFTSPDYIQNYYAESDEDCNCIFEFLNQSNKQLEIYTFIANEKEYRKYYNPLLSSSIQIVQPGEYVEIKFNADKLIKDFGRQNILGINCITKNWSWWYTIYGGLKNKRIRIIAKDDGYNQGLMLYPPFESSDKFELKEINVAYNNKNYLGYQFSDIPDEYKSFYDTRIFYLNNSNNSSRLSNIFTCPCLDIIKKYIENGDFKITTSDGYKLFTLNNDPLDLNNYICKENEDYDFIYEIVNNSSKKILAANILFDENKSLVLAVSNDIEIEAGKSYQIKYNLETLKKIYGEKNIIGVDVKKEGEGQWIRGWFNSFDHKNDKHIVVVSDGTQDRELDIFDLWKDFSELEKGIMIY